MRLIDADKFGMYLAGTQLYYRGWKDDVCETLDDVMIALDETPTVDAVEIVPAVPIDDMFCERLVDRLADKTLNCLKNDIEDASSLGDDCDKKEWLKLLDAVNKELERRNK